MRTPVMMVAAAWLALPGAAAAGGPKPLPRFEDYPAAARLTGPPKQPALRSPVDHRYETRLRRGVLLGEDLFGVAGPARPPRPNFAGAFYAITWSCGSDGCAALAIVDGRTGAVYGPPPGGNANNDEFCATP